MNKQDTKVTVLPDGPIQASRRGIPRLGPDDGVIDFDRARSSIIRRDSFGGKLIDVIDPKTGFCTGVRSNGFSRPVNDLTVKDGVSGGHNSMTRQVVLDRDRSGRYLDADGRVIRTVDMADSPIPCSAGRVADRTTKPQKKGRTVKPTGRDGGPRRPRNPTDYTLPNGTVIQVPGGQSGRFKQVELDSTYRVVAERQGKTLPADYKPTRAAEQAARALLKAARASLLKSHGIIEG
jgi:hypothetical protein